MSLFHAIHRPEAFSARLRAVAIAAVAGLTVAGLTGCSDEPSLPGGQGPDVPSRPDPETYISLLVSTGSGATTRGEFNDDCTGWGEQYNGEAGNAFENRIDTRKIHVTVYDGATGKIIGTLSSSELDSRNVLVQTISEENGLYNVYFNVGSMNLERGKEYVATVIANTDTQPSMPITSGTVCTIRSKGSSRYIAEIGGNSMKAEDGLGADGKSDWEFIYTGKANCYYIRNTVTGHYIGSCGNVGNGGVVPVGDTPVEYYVGRSSQSDSNTTLYWLSSTDCANHNTDAASHMALNRHGGNQGIIAWDSGANEGNSVWVISGIDDTPFVPETVEMAEHDDITFTVGGEFTQEGTGGLPMFGFLRWQMGNIRFPEENPGFPSIGTVYMLRAVCKIEVEITDDYEKYPDARNMSFPAAEDAANEVRLPRLAFIGRHLNRLGNVVPVRENWFAPGKCSIRDLTFDETYNENSSVRWNPAEPSGVCPLTRKEGADGRVRYHIYLPEASGASMGATAQPLRLNVTMAYTDPDLPADDPLKTRYITGTLFPSLNYEGSPEEVSPSAKYNEWKLRRNHIYRFTITGKTDETSLRYQVNETKGDIIRVPEFN